MYFILKGKDWPSKDIKRGAYEKKKTMVSMQQTQRKEVEASEQAQKEFDQLREEDAKYYDDKGNKKLVDFREDPNSKEILKVGEEVRKMKYGGVDRERIDKELNPEMEKLRKHK